MRCGLCLSVLSTATDQHVPSMAQHVACCCFLQGCWIEGLEVLLGHAPWKEAIQVDARGSSRNDEQPHCMGSTCGTFSHCLSREREATGWALVELVYLTTMAQPLI